MKEKRELNRIGAGALILFGSRATGLAREKSDYDIGVLMRNKAAIRTAEQRTQIYRALYHLLSEKINQLVNIDIVFLETAPAELQSHVARHGKLMYEAAPHTFARFKEHTMLLYADFAPYRNLFHRQILLRIS